MFNRVIIAKYRLLVQRSSANAHTGGLASRLLLAVWSRQLANKLQWLHPAKDSNSAQRNMEMIMSNARLS
jgi:hypothetical protein